MKTYYKFIHENKENFIATDGMYYVNRDGTIVIDKDNNTNIVISRFRDHSTHYHIFTTFNVNLKNYNQINAGLTKDNSMGQIKKFFLPIEYYQKYTDKMVNITYEILNNENLLDVRQSYQNRLFKNLIINEWLNKIPELKEKYNIKKQSNKFNL